MCFQKWSLDGPLRAEQAGASESLGRGEGFFRRLVASKSLFENSEWFCGEGFWLRPRRRGLSIPAAGCKGRANAGHSQKSRRPKGFHPKRRWPSLLLGYKPAAGLRPVCVLPFSFFREKLDPSQFSNRL